MTIIQIPQPQRHRRVTSAQFDVLIEQVITEEKYDEIEASTDKFVRRWVDRRVSAATPFYYNDPDLLIFFDVLVSASDCSFDESDKATILTVLETYSRI